MSHSNRNSLPHVDGRVSSRVSAPPYRCPVGLTITFFSTSRSTSFSVFIRWSNRKMKFKPSLDNDTTAPASKAIRFLKRHSVSSSSTVEIWQMLVSRITVEKGRSLFVLFCFVFLDFLPSFFVMVLTRRVGTEDGPHTKIQGQKKEADSQVESSFRVVYLLSVMVFLTYNPKHLVDAVLARLLSGCNIRV